MAPKICSTCNTSKLAGDFYNDSTRKSGKAYRCKSCFDTARKKDSYRWQNLKTTHGITKAQYEEMHRAQGGGCAICTVEHDRLRVDHNHDTGEIRGLLCHSCNVGLGHFRDNDLLLKAAAEYL